MPRRLTADVAIVGGGIIGCLTAYYLTLRGVRPVIIEADAIASGASGASGGWLTPYSASCHPAVIALSPATSGLHAELAERLPEETGIDHRYQPVTYLRCAFTEDGLAELRDWYRLRQAEKFPVEWLAPEDAHRAGPELTGDVLGAVASTGEPTVDSYRLTVSAAQAAEKRGASVLTGRVTGLLTDDGQTGAAVADKVARGVRLEDGSEVSAPVTVLSMGPWTGEAGEWLGYRIPIRPLKGQMLHLERPATGEPPDFTVAMSAFDVGGSILPKRDASTIVGSTREDVGFDRATTAEARDRLLAQGVRISNRLLNARLARQTACLRPITPDQRPYIGPAPRWRGVYLAAGHYSEGIHFGPVTGHALAGMIVDGKPGHDISIYDPGRLLAAGAESG